MINGDALMQGLVVVYVLVAIIYATEGNWPIVNWRGPIYLKRCGSSGICGTACCE